MAAPNLTIAVEPMEGGKALYLPLAASAADKNPQLKNVLRLRITNNHTDQSVVVNAIKFSFPSSSAPAKDMQGVTLVLDPDGAAKPVDANGAIQASQTATWSNGVVDLNPDPDITNNVWNVVYLPEPAPPQIKVSVSCNGFSVPASVTLDLAPYTSPTPSGAFRLPFSGGDLAKGEYLVTSAKHWANGGAFGTQIHAHDISVQLHNAETDGWSPLRASGSKMNNEDYRIWEMPVRAVADGFVEKWHDGMATNTIVADDDGNLQFPDPTPDPVAGNHFWIRHGDVAVLYAHLQAGTLPRSLLVKDAKVEAGQTLGLAGNSGNSTNPHTHIQCQKESSSGPLRGMPFRDAWVLDKTRLNAPDSNALWVPLQSQGIPQEAVAIHPGVYAPYRPFVHEVAVDPLALILRGDIYVKLKLPNPPPIEVLKIQTVEMVRTMAPDERRQALAQVRAFKAYQEVVEQVLNAEILGKRVS